MMRTVVLFVDWLVQRMFWLAIVAMAGTARADVLLWSQSPFNTSGGVAYTTFNPITPGQIRSQSINLDQAARLEQLTLNLGQGFMSSGSGVSVSLWLDQTPGQKQSLVYSGAFRNSWSGLSVYLPKGQSWLSIENTSLSQTIIWTGPTGLSGGALTTANSTTMTDAYAGAARGTYVPEPSSVPALIVAGIIGAGVFVRKVVR